VVRYFQVKKCGAEAGTPNKNGDTPVYISAKNGHTDTVRALVSECGADPDVARNGYPLVCIQVMMDNLDVVRELVKCKADPNAADFNGRTPVFLAVNLKLTEMVQVLVRDCNADPYIANNKGVTPLCRAATLGYSEMVWTLVRKCGVDPTGLDRSRRQLLAFAMTLHPRLGSASRASVLDDCLLEIMLAPHLTPGPLASEITEQNKKMKTVKLLNWLQAPEGATPTAEELYEGYRYVRRTLNI
jgi:hypothetical protein